MQVAQVGDDVEVAEALPDGLLHLRCHPELGEIFGRFRVSEIRRDTQLELALAPGIGIAVAKTRIRQVLTELPYRLAPLATREFIFERLTVRT